MGRVKELAGAFRNKLTRCVPNTRLATGSAG